MSIRAVHHAHCLHRHRSAPIRAAFLPCRCQLSFCMQSRRIIWRVPSATGYLSNAAGWMTALIDASRHQAMTQIPIATRPSMATAKRPAVSSLGAYPTPAH